ncbi:MAG: hypothetical protein OD815_001932 [Candidatus Alkanophagales archaeon MCA70_species_2]|nr:hypothetical protein [Candidatus Alkanophaga liquidiphilum]
MSGRRSGEKFSSRGMYMGSTSDIPPKCKDIRNSYISPDWNDMRSIADMNELAEIPPRNLNSKNKGEYNEY